MKEGPKRKRGVVPTGHSTRNPEAGTSGHVRRPRLSGRTQYLLVVDPDGNERFTMSMLLQRFGYSVAGTSNAHEAVEFLCVAPADAVFIEAGRAGDEFAARLKGDARFKDVPIIMVSGSPDRSLEKRLREGEFTGLLRKPLDPHEVYGIIQKVIEKGKRRNIRIPAALPAVLHVRSGITTGYVTVLSQFGMFFRTLELLPVASHAAVELTLWGRTVSVEAEVLYVVAFEEGPFSEPGMGMKFVRIQPEDSTLIKLYIYEQLGIEPEPPVSCRGPITGQA